SAGTVTRATVGRFERLGVEMRTIVIETIDDIPLGQLEAAARAVPRQLTAVRTGEGVLDSLWHTYGIMERFTPSVLPAMHAARQQQGALDFRVINLIHVPVALGSIALLIAALVLARPRPHFA